MGARARCGCRSRIRPAACPSTSQSVEMKARSNEPSARPRRANKLSCNGLRSNASISRRASVPLARVKAVNCRAMALSKGGNLRTAMRIVVLMRLPLASQTRLQGDGLRAALQGRQHVLQARAALLFQHGDREGGLHRGLRRPDWYADIHRADKALPVSPLIAAGPDCCQALQKCRPSGGLFLAPLFF